MPGSTSVGGDARALRFPSARPGATGGVRVAYPSADEFGDGYAVYTTSSRMVGVTEPLASFVTDVAGFGLRAVVMTRTDAALSAQVVSVLGRLGGYWVAQGADAATFDVLSGRRLQVIEDLWTAVDDAASRARLTVPVVSGSSVRVLGFDVHVEHPADASTRVGPLVQAVVEGLGGGRLDRWGVREPLTQVWDEAAITALVQSQMPKSQTILAGGDDGGFAQVQVSRTKTGLLEHASGGVLAPPGASTVDLVGIASRALEQIAAGFKVVVGVVSVAEYDRADSIVGGGHDDAQVIVRRARGYPPEVPLAVVLGTRTAHEMGLDVAELSERFDVRPVGPGRAAALVVRLGGEGGPWGQFAEFARHALPKTTSAGVA